MRHSRSKPQPAAPIAKDQPAGRPRPQFSILGMFVVMLICSVASSGAYYLVRADGTDASPPFFVMLSFVAKNVAFTARYDNVLCTYGP